MEMGVGAGAEPEDGDPEGLRPQAAEDPAPGEAPLKGPEGAWAGRGDTSSEAGWSGAFRRSGKLPAALGGRARTGPDDTDPARH